MEIIRPERSEFLKSSKDQEPTREPSTQKENTPSAKKRFSDVFAEVVGLIMLAILVLAVLIALFVFNPVIGIIVTLAFGKFLFLPGSKNS